MKNNIYLQLTNEFNAGKVRAIICSVLAMIKEGLDRLEAALDAERRDLIHANEPPSTVC